jgi:hypothetical protein
MYVCDENLAILFYLHMLGGHVASPNSKEERKVSQLRTDGQGPILKASPFRGTCSSAGLSVVHKVKEEGHGAKN